MDIVYHSHLLEHLDQEEGENLTKECLRVLKPGGILRISVPDLERICQDYLLSLQSVDQNIKFAQVNADWMRMELFDQMTRTFSGGEMLKFLKSNPANKEFLIKRCGKNVFSNLTTGEEEINFNSSSKTVPFHLKFKASIKKITDSNWLIEKLIKLIFSNTYYEAFRLGRFQQSGELHRHMYDRISLKELLEKVGFVECTIHSHTSSLIPKWRDFCLDNSNQGEPKKPDSLYLEAVKPK